MIGRPRTYTDEDMIAALKEEAVDGKLSIETYVRSGRRPSVDTIRHRFGKWSVALNKADLESLPRGRYSPRRKVIDASERLVAAWKDRVCVDCDLEGAVMDLKNALAEYKETLK